MRGCKPERVRIGKRPVNFPPKSKTVFPPLRSNWEDYGPAKMPTRYNEHVGESEVRIAPMSLMARQIMREELLRNRREASPAKSSSSKSKSPQPSPGKPKVGTGSIYDVLDRRDPEGEVMEATLPDGRKVRVRVPPGALGVDARHDQSVVEVAPEAPRTPSPRKPDDDLACPASPPPHRSSRGPGSDLRVPGLVLRRTRCWDARDGDTPKPPAFRRRRRSAAPGRGR